MNIIQKAEVHFHQQEQLSVYLESNSTDEFEKVGEIGLLTMFALRQLSNLGTSEEAAKLAKFLCAAGELVAAFASGESPGGFELIPYPGHEGRKRFYATVELHTDQIRFDMKPEGFDLLGTGLGYYAPIAVLGMFQHLARRRVTDEEYLRQLAAAVCLCGGAHMRGEVGLTNQLQLGRSFIVTTCGALLYSGSGELNTSAREQADANTCPKHNAAQPDVFRTAEREACPTKLVPISRGTTARCMTVWGGNSTITWAEAMERM